MGEAVAGEPGEVEVGVELEEWSCSCAGGQPLLGPPVPSQQRDALNSSSPDRFLI